MKRNATAVWRGSLRSGAGAITTGSSVLSAATYDFGARFEGKRGTNPEELVAAAHASCFSMALAAELAKVNLIADCIETHATVNLSQDDDGWSVRDVRLVLSAQIPNITAEIFNGVTEAAKNNCPISRLLRAPITLEKTFTTGVVSKLQEAG